MRSTKRPVDRGFTLLEAMIALLLLTVIMGAFLAMLNTFSGLVKVQGNIADTTENMRYTMAALVRVTRMAGTGGLPVVYPDSGGNLAPLAVDVADNVGATTTFTSSINSDPWTATAGRTAIAGTDVLRIRGVITSPNYDVFGGNFDDPDAPTQVDVPETSPWSTDPLNPFFNDMSQPDDHSGRPFLISLQFPLDINPSIGGQRRYATYRIVEATNDAAGGSSPNQTQVFYIDDTKYTNLNPNGISPGAVPSTQAYAAGYVDDYIFYIAENNFGEPSLYRLRIDDSGAGPFTAEELVPNVSDFQVALGCDIDIDGSLADDEWYLSEATPAAPTADQFAALREVRLSVVSRTQDPDLKWTADADMPENAADLSGDDLRYRYRTITVRVALRSHPQLSQ
ncbi:MAG: PilW family protein [Acidobacteriota bacterium]